MNEELVNMWKSKLKEGQAKIFDFAVSRYPMKFTRNQLATLTGFSSKSSAYQMHVASLIRNGLLETVDEGVVRASEMLFKKI